MESYEFYLDQKVTVWQRTKFNIEAKNITEAKKLAIEFHLEGNTDELPWETLEDTFELLTVEDNKDNSTEHIFLDEEDIWDNTKA